MKEFGSNYSQKDFFSKKEGFLAPTPEQKKAAEISSYIERINIFNKGSKSFIDWKEHLPEQGIKEKRKSLKEKANLAFEELYKADGSQEGMQVFYTNWGKDAGKFENIFNELKPEVASSTEKITKNASALSLKDRVSISIRAAKAWAKLSGDQRDQLFSIAGYSKKEISDIAKKIGISAGLNAGLFWGFESIGAAVGGGVGVTNPFIGHISEGNAQIAIALSYLAYWSSLGLNAQQNLRLLRNESINTSPSVIATGTFFLLKKLLPRDERMQNWGTRLGSLSLDLFLEALWFATMFIPEIGPSILASANLAGAGLNGLQAAVSEGVLRYKKHKKKDN